MGRLGGEELVASFADHEATRSLLHAADQALYAAKERGRNRAWCTERTSRAPSGAATPESAMANGRQGLAA